MTWQEAAVKIATIASVALIVWITRSAQAGVLAGVLAALPSVLAGLPSGKAGK